MGRWTYPEAKAEVRMALSDCPICHGTGVDETVQSIGVPAACPKCGGRRCPVSNKENVSVERKTQALAAAVELISYRNAALPKMIIKELRASIALVVRGSETNEAEARIRNAVHVAIEYIVERYPHAESALPRLVITELRVAVLWVDGSYSR